MSSYYVNKNAQPNGDHEVHKDGCNWMPDILNREYVGFYSTCQEAVREAKKKYYKSNGCFYCCYSCHTS